MQNSWNFVKITKFPEILEILVNFQKFSDFCGSYGNGPQMARELKRAWYKTLMCRELKGGRGLSIPILSPSDSLLPFQVVDALIQTSVCMVRTVLSCATVSYLATEDPDPIGILTVSQKTI